MKAAPYVTKVLTSEPNQTVIEVKESVQKEISKGQFRLMFFLYWQETNF